MVFKAKLFIDGRSVSAHADAVFERVDPTTNQAATVAAAASVADAIEAANSAAAAFPAWSSTTPAERRSILETAADLLERRADEIVAAMAAETGASEPWGRFNCHLGASMLRDAATRTDSVGESEIPTTKPGAISWAVRQPAGVVLSMAPWNAPVVLAARAVAVPLACANTVILKASELCPKTHSLIAEVINEAGVPNGALNLVSNAPEKAPEQFGVEVLCRIGINSGPAVLASISAASQDNQESIIGDTVNVASRLEGIAGAGGILISEDTFRLVGRYADCIDAGVRLLRGKSTPQRVYQLTGIRPYGNRFDGVLAKGLSAFVGRESQLLAIADRWRIAQDDNLQIVGVRGAAGIGKSRLVHELCMRVSQGEHLYGQCRVDSRSTPFHSLIGIIRTRFDIPVQSETPFIESAIRDGLKHDVLILEPHLPYLANLLGSVEESRLAHIDNEIVGIRTREALSGRALARATVGGGWSGPALSVAGGCAVPP